MYPSIVLRLNKEQNRLENIVINVAKYRQTSGTLNIKKTLWGYQWWTGEWLKGGGEAANIGVCRALKMGVPIHGGSWRCDPQGNRGPGFPQKLLAKMKREMCEFWSYMRYGINKPKVLYANFILAMKSLWVYLFKKHKFKQVKVVYLLRSNN